KGEIAKQAETAGADIVFPPEEIDALGDDIARAKTLAEEYDFFIAEAEYMPTIGKKIGIVLGPRGKMPEPLMPGKNIADVLNKRKNSIKVRSKDRMTFHLAIGRKDMDPEKIADNAEAVMEHVERALVNGVQNLKSIYVSTTMGPSVKVM
ncbi:MAG: 50S ribosomal protein L1, partial [Gammaproteobacteria bacterium]|nr:50S ribosomal protein L1 [Gammaproteobacteria bacterium]